MLWFLANPFQIKPALPSWSEAALSPPDDCNNAEAVLEDRPFYHTYLLSTYYAPTSQAQRMCWWTQQPTLSVFLRLTLYSEIYRQSWCGRGSLVRHTQPDWDFAQNAISPRESKSLSKPGHFWGWKVALQIIKRVIRQKSGPPKENQIEGHLIYRSTSGT